MHCQIVSPQPQQGRLKFHLNNDRQSADCEEVCLASAFRMCVLRHFKDNLRLKISAFSAKNKKNKNDKLHFWPKMKMAKAIKNSHFRRQQRRRILVGLYSGEDVDSLISDIGIYYLITMKEHLVLHCLTCL